ncbi:MAG: membrane lipoprotein lipid attachment site-containing protein [Erysipelotrichaceae bacterium]|nr:membrane lipoprotein lipid attachment site-containing protein [Erysipelotrichaceae bacterium]
MKKTILFILFVFMLVSCSSSVGETNTIPGSSGLDHVDPIGGITQYTSENADPDNELVIEATVEYLPVYETEIELKLIGRVVSVDGCDNYWADYGYGGIYTYGKIEVIKPLKGEISEGDIIGFAIGGGTVSFEQYAKSQDPQALARQMSLLKEKGSGVPSYVTTKISATEIEEGKVYFIVTSAKRDIHGDLYLIYPYAETLLEIDESTLENEEIMGYSPEWKTWKNVLDIWFLENENDTRTKRDD